MSISEMTSLQRVLTTLGHQEPDRVPLILLLTMHGAKELGLSIQAYFSKPEYVVEGQLRLREKYRHDCLYGFFYAAVETEAWGGEVVYFDDGPPNAGAPIFSRAAQIDTVEPPDVTRAPPTRRVLTALSALKARVGDDVPIIGVVMSPFSLPVMQLGFSGYLDLMHDDPKRFERLMAINQAFTVQWANAQLAAGATAICYFDPVSSSSIIPPERYRQTGLKVAKRTIGAINGPTATHFASGLSRPILEDVATSGTVMVGVSTDESLAEIKAITAGKMSILGNLNALEMCRWSIEETEQKVKQAIHEAAPGGGFMLSDNHGEIPWQVPEETLMAVSEANRRWGRYPIRINDT
ncbi:MAG: uroporphyrinogen decarboxylase family protein [Magnetococcales bacterium]|nr:uroporphyrinogen decarboxylase family protein [Magnetococcales bacterium]